MNRQRQKKESSVCDLSTNIIDDNKCLSVSSISQIIEVFHLARNLILILEWKIQEFLYHLIIVIGINGFRSFAFDSLL